MIVVRGICQELCRKTTNDDTEMAVTRPRSAGGINHVIQIFLAKETLLNIRDTSELITSHNTAWP